MVIKQQTQSEAFYDHFMALPDMVKHSPALPEIIAADYDAKMISVELFDERTVMTFQFPVDKSKFALCRSKRTHGVGRGHYNIGFTVFGD